MKIDLKDLENNAVSLYRGSDNGILSTVSKKHDDYPFGSFVTYVSGSSRTAYLYLSDLADHTKNLHHSPKSSLTIIKLNTVGDKQNSERLTVMGDLVPVDKNELESCRERYYQILPASKAYAKMHDFNFYKIQIKNVRWIGGFGKIAWLDVSNWEDKSPKWDKSEVGIIEHMNEDHSDTIIAALKAQHGIVDMTAKMVMLTIDGYYLRTKNELFFIKFPKACYNSKEYKDALISLAKMYK
tara:strand:- start:356 stop:1075 length:720 start_codon:yes stop_codon:yes gene_type:complete